MSVKPFYVVEERLVERGYREVYSGTDDAEARRNIPSVGMYRLLTFKIGEDSRTYVMIGHCYANGKREQSFDSMVILRKIDIQRLEQICSEEE